MSIACQATSAAQRPLQRLLVTLECLNNSRYTFQGLTDEYGRITTWFWAREERAPFSGSFSHIVQSDDYEWKLCFEIYRFVPENSAVKSIPVIFRINRDLQCDIHLILDMSQPQSYYVLIDGSSITDVPRAAPADLLSNPVPSQNGPQPAQADVDETWLSELISGPSTLPATQNPGIGGSSTHKGASVADWVDVSPSGVKPEPEDFRNMLSWSPSIPSHRTGRQTKVTGNGSKSASVENGPHLKRKAVDAPSADNSPTPTTRPIKRPRTNGPATRKSQRLKLREMEKSGEYIPLE